MVRKRGKSSQPKQPADRRLPHTRQRLRPDERKKKAPAKDESPLRRPEPTPAAPKRTPKKKRAVVVVKKVNRSGGFAASFVKSCLAMEHLPHDKKAQIAVAGRSNVGKSSLLNRLFGEKGLAKVSSTPGKTQALNFFLVNDQFYIVDLPGYGYAKVPEQIRRSWGKLLESFLTGSPHLSGLILLLDSRRTVSPEDLQMMNWLAARQLPLLPVLTKCDKLSTAALANAASEVSNRLGVSPLLFSAVTGQGKQELIRAVRNLLSGRRDAQNEQE